MGVLTYTAKRNIIGGHTIDTVYQIETAFQIIDQDAREFGTSIEMLGGAIEYDLDRLTEFVSLRSDVVVEADLLEWKEFLTSVQGRETFSVDLTGTIASPGTDLSSIMHRGGFKPVRTQPGVQSYTFNFVVRLL